MRELEDLRGRTGPGLPEDRLLESQILMLGDPELIGRVEQGLAERKKNTEVVLQQVVAALAAKLAESGDEYLRERSSDIHDVAERILGQLASPRRPALSGLEEECIVVAHTLLPSDLISMDRRKVLGLAADSGGRTSHVAILARSFAIPAVLGLPQLAGEARTGDLLIVDGTRGQVRKIPREFRQGRLIFSRMAYAVLIHMATLFLCHLLLYPGAYTLEHVHLFFSDPCPADEMFHIDDNTFCEVPVSSWNVFKELQHTGQPLVQGIEFSMGLKTGKEL